MAKTISERASRFLPVDMKDRLKSALLRNAGPAPEPANSPADDLPDYSAIFAHRARAATPPPVSAPWDQTQLAEPTVSVTMKNPARQIAQISNEIEEAEIVSEPRDGAAANSAWQSAALKTRKAETSSPVAAVELASPIAIDTPDFSAMFKARKTASVENGVSPSNGAIIDSGGAARPVVPAKPAFIEAAQQELQAAKQDLQDDLKYPSSEKLSGTSNHEEPVAQKSKFRFFSESSESVRLKVEKRPEERPAAEAPESNLSQHTAEPARAESKPLEAAAQRAQAAPTSLLRDAELPKDANRVMTQAVTAAPAASEQPNFKLQKENAAMDAKGPETENGAAVKAEGNAAGSTIAIERNSKFSGQLKFSGAIAIDGQVEGELVAERIVVHEGGVVNATVEGNTVIIAGTVKGDILARNELEILPSGVVNGSITSPTINVRRGGRVEGRCAIGVPRP